MNTAFENIAEQDVFVKHECAHNGHFFFFFNCDLDMTLTLTDDLDFGTKESIHGPMEYICEI